MSVRGCRDFSCSLGAIRSVIAAVYFTLKVFDFVW